MSLMAPKDGMEDRVLELDRSLVEWLQGQPGFVRGYLIVDGDPFTDIAALTRVLTVVLNGEPFS